MFIRPNKRHRTCNRMIETESIKTILPYFAQNGTWGALCTFFADLQTLTPTCPVQNAGSKPFRQLATNRCLRGFINMSGVDTIFESVSACVQTTNHLENCPEFD